MKIFFFVDSDIFVQDVVYWCMCLYVEDFFEEECGEFQCWLVVDFWYVVEYVEMEEIWVFSELLL